MKRVFLFFFIFFAGCAIPTQNSLIQPGQTMINDPFRRPIMEKTILPDLGEAPEWTTSVWINIEKPLQLKDLRGKVVLLNMWTYGCINCRNVVPKLVSWEKTYSEKGLVIVGNHFPEFEQEKDLQNLKRAVIELGIEYPVTQDNNGQIWKAYGNRFWPTLYLIDKEGRVRYTHIGEGDYDKTEEAIEQLLNE